MRFKKLRALTYCLFVRKDLLYVRKLCAGQREQRVVNFELDASDNVKMVVPHQVVDLVDGAVCAVLNGKNAVLAQTLLNGAENALKVFKI